MIPARVVLPPDLVRFAIAAPNIHQGGGYLLLSQLVKAIAKRHVLSIGTFDSRCKESLSVPIGDVVWVDKSIFSRVSAHLRLFRSARSVDVFLILNGTPPYKKMNKPVAMFLQNALLISNFRHEQGTFLGNLKLVLERLVFRMYSKHIDTFYVQTETMAEMLKENLKKQLSKSAFSEKKICVIPFAQCERHEKGRGKNNNDFVYVADASKHKNHKNLFDAWVMLANMGLFPSLVLTFNDSELSKHLELIKAQNPGVAIENVGVLSHQSILNLMCDSRCLVYPSFTESLGLPLVEASQLGVPIVASEKVFVRDVCVPVETFDPESPRSIAQAVCRFMGVPVQARKVRSSNEFIDAVCDDL